MVPEPDDSSDSGGVLGRGWTPSARFRVFVLVAVGLVLVAHPLVGGLPDAAGLTGNVEYTAYEVSPDGAHLDYSELGDDDSNAPPGVLLRRVRQSPPIDCYPRVDDRACTLEAALTDQRVTVPSATEDWRGYTYHGGFYERVVTPQNDSLVLSLRTVSAATVLANVSVPASDWSAPVRRAVETGTVATDPPLSLAGSILVRDGTYYVVLPEDGDQTDDSPGPVASVVSAGVGTLLVRRGVRQVD